MKIFSVFMVIHILQAKIKYAHGLLRKVMEWLTPVFLMQTFSTKTDLFRECTDVQKDLNESDENFDSPLDNEPTFSSSIFHEGLIVNVENIEERLK